MVLGYGDFWVVGIFGVGRVLFLGFGCAIRRVVLKVNRSEFSFLYEGCFFVILRVGFFVRDCRRCRRVVLV